MILKSKIVFYDETDFDGNGSKALFEKLNNTKQFVKYIGLNRKMNIYDRFDKSSKQKTEAVHYLEYIDSINPVFIDEVVFLDLAPRNIKEALKLRDILDDNQKVIIIDHHVMQYNPNNIKGFEYFSHKEDGYPYSATMLTWKYFKKNEEHSDCPALVKYINDYDVWDNKFQPKTNYIKNIFEMIKNEEINDLILMDEKNETFKAWLKIGEIREESNQKEISKTLKRLKIVEKDGLKIGVLTGNINQELGSEIGNRACVENDIDLYAYYYFNEHDEEYSYSLRSLNNEALKYLRSVSKVGGGHNNACGFRSRYNVLEDFKDVK